MPPLYLSLITHKSKDKIKNMNQYEPSPAFCPPLAGRMPESCTTLHNLYLTCIMLGYEHFYLALLGFGAAMPLFLKPEEIAEQLRVSLRSVYGWLERGELVASRAGNRWRVQPADLEAYLKRPRLVGGHPPSIKHRAVPSELVAPAPGTGISVARAALMASYLGPGSSPPLSPVPGSGVDRGVSGPAGAAGAGASPGSNPLANRKQKRGRR